MWFVQLEAQFALVCATTNATKFNHALAGVGEEFVTLVAGVLSGCSYTRLNDQLIRRLSVCERAKLNYLLTDLTLDGRTPSQLLQEMKQLSGTRSVRSP